MPLFKKFLVVIIINLIIILAAYITIYSYSLNNGEKFKLFKDYGKIIAYGAKDLKNSLLLQFINMLSDMIVFIFAFRFNQVTDNIKYYAMIIGICSIPFLILLFQFLTYRGFYAFRLKIKKAKANPFYYRDYVESNKDFGNDNIDEVDNTMLILLIPLRLAIIIIFLIIVPVMLIVDLVFELIGLLRGITNTGKALDFE